jgi:hypothetical protein
VAGLPGAARDGGFDARFDDILAQADVLPELGDGVARVLGLAVLGVAQSELRVIGVDGN